MNDNEQYLRPEDVSKIFKVTVRTLSEWEKQGRLKSIRTKGGHRRFLKSDIEEKFQGFFKPEKQNFCYCRVSSPSQKEDLERQVEYLKSRYPNYRIIRDIGSGLNFKRKGFNTILNTAIKGDLGTLVVTNRDRLCRFGFEFFQGLIESSNGKLVVLDQEQTSPEKELVNDLLSIITIFSSELPGLRSHAFKKKIRNEALKDYKNKVISNEEGEGSVEGNV